MQVQGQAEQSRVLLVSVPYAFKAHEAETLGGLPASAFVKAATSEISTSISTDANNSQNAGTAGTAVSTTATPGKTKRSRPLFTGTDKYISIFDSTSPDGLSNSLMSQLNAGRVDVNGNINLQSDTNFYGLGATGTPLLSTGGNRNNGNLFVGIGSGASNAGSVNNAFSGYQAGYSNTGGSYNAFFGYKAGYSNTGGGANTFVGYLAGFSNTASNNTFIGSNAGLFNTTGNQNTYTGTNAGRTGVGVSNNAFYGYSAGQNNTAAGNTFLGSSSGLANTSGAFNTFVGIATGYGNTTGGFNLFVGHISGYNNTTGQYNIFVGDRSGFYNTTGSYNIEIGNQGTATDQKTIRIGDPATQTATYFAGIFGQPTVSGSPVFIDSTGKLGTTGGAGLVSSFNNRAGAVMPAQGDYSFSQISGTLNPSQIPAGSNNYIQNGASQQSASFNISGNGTIGGNATIGGMLYLPNAANSGDALLCLGNSNQVGYCTPGLLSELQKQQAVVASQQSLIKTLQEQMQTQGQQLRDLQQRLSQLESFVTKK